MKFTIRPEDFLVKEHKPLHLRDCTTSWDDLDPDDKHYENELEEYKKEIFRLQNIMLAHDKYSLLLIFQGMDTAGKDGAISHVMSGINPTGVQVYSFKKPSAEELDHDYLWRCMVRLPERGRIGIFNRSYYEEVGIVKVHEEVLNGQRLPEEFTKDREKLWKHRYEDIRDVEKYLHRNGTLVIKFFLHISKEEQRKRFLERIEKPEKNWKFSPYDLAERKHWDKYQQAYSEALLETSTENSPWYIIPGDKKKTARLIISRIVLHHLGKLNIDYPDLPPDQKALLAKMRDELLNEPS